MGTIRSADYLKGRFITGAIPTSEDFEDLIATGLSSGYTDFEGFGLVITTAGGVGTLDASTASFFLQASTTSEIIDLFIAPEDTQVFIPTTTEVIGTAGISVSGDLESGLTISLDGSAAAGWVDAGNRVNTDARGRLLSTSMVLTDFGFAYETSIQQTQAISVVNPSIASAQSIFVHVSALTADTASYPIMTFLDKSGAAIAGVQTASIFSQKDKTSFSSASYTDGTMRISAVTAIPAGSYHTYDIEMVAHPAARSAFVRGAFRQIGGNRASLFTCGMVESADTTVAGLQIYLNGDVTIEPSGSVRVNIL